MAIDFDLSDVAKEAVQLSEEDLESEVKNMIRPSAEAVQQAAINFYNKYTDCMKVIESWRNKVSKKSFNRKKERYLFEHGVREAFDEFQNSINAYFGQLVKVLYVYVDPQSGKMLLSVLDNDASHFTLEKGDPRYYIKKLQNFLNFQNYDSTLLDITEQSIYTRWNIAKSKLKKGQQAQHLPILWYTGKWHGMWVNNLGTISEAYAGFYLSKYQFSGNLEPDVGTYLVAGCAAVDNASGFLQGDTQSNFSNDLSVQWAVKKALAQPAGMKDVANFIKEIGKDFTPEAFWQKFIIDESNKAKKSQVTPILNQALKKTVNSLVEDYNEKNIGYNLFR